MRCHCGEKAKASDTRQRPEGCSRVRICKNGHRFRTIESVVEDMSAVTEEMQRDTAIQMIKDGRLQKTVAYTLGLHRNKISKFWSDYTRQLGESLR